MTPGESPMQYGKQHELKIDLKPLQSLHPHSRNARTHSKHQIRQIAESIRVFGFTNPVLVDAENQIVAGHGRVEAAKLLGMEEVSALVRCEESRSLQPGGRSDVLRRIQPVRLMHSRTILAAWRSLRTFGLAHNSANDV